MLANEFLGAVAQHLCECGIRFQDSAVEGAGADSDRGSFKHRPEAPITVASHASQVASSIASSMCLGNAAHAMLLELGHAVRGLQQLVENIGRAGAPVAVSSREKRRSALFTIGGLPSVSGILKIS